MAEFKKQKTSLPPVRRHREAPRLKTSEEEENREGTLLVATADLKRRRESLAGARTFVMCVEKRRKTTYSTAAAGLGVAAAFEVGAKGAVVAALGADARPFAPFLEDGADVSGGLLARGRGGEGGEEGEEDGGGAHFPFCFGGGFVVRVVRAGTKEDVERMMLCWCL